MASCEMPQLWCGPAGRQGDLRCLQRPSCLMQLRTQGWIISELWGICRPQRCCPSDSALVDSFRCVDRQRTY
eukprot:14843386-Alexandrium_andersonii.AAC.1